MGHGEFVWGGEREALRPPSGAIEIARLEPNTDRDYRALM